MVCFRPLGAPVEPEVYRINSGSSAPIASASHSLDCLSTSSSNHTSRPFFHSISPPVRFTTRTFLQTSVPSRVSAASTFSFNGTCLPPRTDSSAVITSLESAPITRWATASGEKPPKTTECTAPMRAQASIAMAASGIIGIYSVTVSPLRMPSSFSALAS